ncbi:MULTISPECIES: hypothetical protein [Arthrobacter]|uniref:Uncharacterized protein n=1 Tax=Arthrobacter terricola TaxID=2547396 RepID=A0A4V6PID2_9MICC|nr:MULTISPECIES: hypothetical protein [Arthrobacter]MBT8162666.1 hypothetical protein [Arthrobacter sp. GN70]TDF92444.1 hypothetical protein E1809_18055 [Arthrobacter terricola]
MEEDRSDDHTGTEVPGRAVPRPGRKLFVYMGCGWLALGIVWLITVITNGPTLPWQIAVGVLFMMFGIGYLIGGFRSKSRLRNKGRST